MTYKQLRLEYIDFISKWDKLKINCTNVYNSQKKNFEESADESDNSPGMHSLFQNIVF